MWNSFHLMGGNLPLDACDSFAKIVCSRIRLLSGSQLHVGTGNAVVPAQPILVKNAPEITKSSGKRGEKRRQHPPSAQTAIEWCAVKSRQPQAGDTKSRSRARIHHKQEFVAGPKKNCDHNDRAGKHQEKRSVDVIDR